MYSIFRGRYGGGGAGGVGIATLPIILNSATHVHVATYKSVAYLALMNLKLTLGAVGTPPGQL